MEKHLCFSIDSKYGVNTQGKKCSSNDEQKVPDTSEPINLGSIQHYYFSLYNMLFHWALLH